MRSKNEKNKEAAKTSAGAFDEDLDRFSLYLMRLLKNLARDKKVPRIRKETLRFNMPLIDSILSGRLDRQQSMQSAVTIISSILSADRLEAEDRDYLVAAQSKMKADLREMNRDKPLEQITALVMSDSPEDVKRGLMRLGDEVKNGYRDGMDGMVEKATNALMDSDPEMAMLASKFIYYASSFRSSVFQYHRDGIMKAMKSQSASVRASVVMACAAARDMTSLDSLASLASDHSTADIGALGLSDYKIKFPHEGPRARVSDVVRDAVYEIIEARNDNSLYIRKSIKTSVNENMVTGKEYSLDMEITPLVDLKGLEIDLTGMLGEFDVVGNRVIGFDLLKAGEMKFVDPIKIIPETPGHRKGKIRCKTSNGWEAVLEIEAVVSEPIKNNVKSDNQSDQPHVSGVIIAGQSSPIDLLGKDIQSMEITRAVNALDELIRFAGDDTGLKNRIESLKLMLTYKGTTMMTKSEMDSAMELVENVKRRMYT